MTGNCLYVKRAHRVIQEVRITFDRFYVGGGHGFPAELNSRAECETGLPYLGKIEYDRVVADAVLAGESLLEIPESSVGYRSVAGMMERVLG